MAETSRKETGLIERERKVTAVEMFWVLVNSLWCSPCKKSRLYQTDYEKFSNKN